MKGIKTYIVESSKEKINNAGKKKLTKFIDDLIKHVDDIFDYAGIPADDADQVDSDCRDTVWNWVDDNNIVSWSTKDDDTVRFVTDEYERLAQAICDKYNL